MPDSPSSPRRERALLADLAPDVDTEAAWDDLRHRFERDRRHRRTVGVASAAAVLIVLVLAVGAGFAARRPADPDLRVGGPDPAGDAPGTEGGTAPSGLPVVPPTVVHISCSDGIGAVEPATAVAGPGGVALSLEGS